MIQPVFFGLAGPTISADERALFTAASPAGFILFKRNIETRAQVRALTDALRDLTGRADTPILVDQEGGRVARLQPPEWPAFPAGAAFDTLYERAPMTAIQTMRLNAQALGAMLAEVGINVNCAPVVDVRQAGAHDIIGDRALGMDPQRVAALGRATLDGLQAGGCVGVIKHMPGHGRALADSHLELPIVTADVEALAVDIAPFRALKDAPMAMTAHVVYTAWDAARCATLSPRVVRDVIRGQIGFDGLLMSDDLGMKALSGDEASKARGVLAAGVDIILHCSGDIDAMRVVSAALDAAPTETCARLDRAMASLADRAVSPPYHDLIAQRDALMAAAA